MCVWILDHELRTLKVIFVVDFGTNQMTWLTPTQCTDPLQVAYWTNDGVAMVPMIVESGQIKVPVTIDGHSIVAVIDTSSERTVMRRDIAEQVMGFKPGTPDMMPAGDTKDGKALELVQYCTRHGSLTDLAAVAIEGDEIEAAQAAAETIHGLGCAFAGARFAVREHEIRAVGESERYREFGGVLQGGAVDEQ